jgi:deferrochelatase/peroxidase EfeB
VASTHEARPEGRPTRAGFLAGAAGAVGALLAGAKPAAAAPSPHRQQRQRHGQQHGRPALVPFHGRHQAGIVTPLQDHVCYAAFDVTVPDRAGLVELLRDLTRAAAALTRGDKAPPPHYHRPGMRADSGVGAGLRPARLTVTFGFGPGLFDDRYGLAGHRPDALADLPVFADDRLNPAWCGGDLLLQMAGDDPQLVAYAFRQLRARFPGRGLLQWTQEGFRSTAPGQRNPRNLFGQLDGTANLQGAALDRIVWVRDDPQDWLNDGAFLVFRKIRMLVPDWDLTPAAEQDGVIGRRGTDGRLLAPLPSASHVRIARPFTMYRRAYNYDYGIAAPHGCEAPADDHDDDDGPGDHDHGGQSRHDLYDQGLLFATVARDPNVFIRAQRALSRSDAMSRFVEHTGSAIFALPPGVSRSGFIGEGLF